MTRTGEVILDSLYNNAILQELIPSRIPKTRIGILFSVIAAEFEGWETVLDNYKNETFLSTAVLVDSIVALCEPLYVKSESKPSDVIVGFRWKTTVSEEDKTDTVIPFGQIITTADEDPIEYMTIERKVLYKTSTVIYTRARSVESGAHTMVGSLYISKINPDITNVEVWNDNPSWGGKDEETTDSIKNNALATRYTLGTGTQDHIKLSLSNAGLPSSDYNILDQAYGYGTFCIYIRTENDEQISEISELIADVRSEGIYSECLQATQMDTTMDIVSSFSREKNFTPEEYNLMIASIQGYVLTFIEDNGVGNKVYVNKLKHYILETFKDDDMYEVDITFTSDIAVDYLGNAVISPEEYLNVTSMNIELEIG